MKFLSIFDEPAMYLLYLILGFGIIALVVFLCRKYIPALNNEKTNVKPDDIQIAKEELDRLLVSVDELKEGKKEETADVEEAGTEK